MIINQFSVYFNTAPDLLEILGPGSAALELGSLLPELLAGLLPKIGLAVQGTVFLGNPTFPLEGSFTFYEPDVNGACVL